LQSKGNSSGTVSDLNLSEVVLDKVDPSSITNSSALGYFNALCRQPVPGPLVGGSAASKDVNKWLDEMISWYGPSSAELQRGDTRKLLISLLKIPRQHYGKLRSPFGSDQEVPYPCYFICLLYFLAYPPLPSVVWTSLGPLPRWVPGPTTRWAPGTTRLALHGT
jgi:hypothetical protein